MNFIRSIYHFLWSWGGNLIYGKPSREIFVLGVTGTKGKSTTLRMINEILKESGAKTALLTSVNREVAGDLERNETPNTMPGRWQLQKFLRDAVDAGCSFALIEVTSQGVEQHRHKFIDWDGGVFLNLAPEHIEAHGSFEEYKEAKLDFFRYIDKSKKETKLFFVNKEDSDSGAFAKVANVVESGRLVLFSIDDVHKLVEEVEDFFEDRGGDMPSWVKADFNKENIAAAASFAKEVGIEEGVIKSGLISFEGVEGRLEFVQKEPFGVVVDYAHTPDSMRALYRSLKGDFEYDGDLICVFGSAGGGRDKWKRPEMGEISGRYCNKVILTSEDPYEEDPMDIIEDIKEGLAELEDSQKPEVFELPDRREALKKAISLASEGDVVASVGMGDQPYMWVGDEKIDWDERQILKELLNQGINA